MQIFIAGIMQGSETGPGMQAQNYRQTIRQAVEFNHPDAQIIDPFSLFPDSAAYADARARQVLLAMAEAAGAADIVIAYLPEASMGTAFEMLRAYDRGKAIICISPMKENWVIRAVAAKIFPSLDLFCAWVRQTSLAELI